MAALSDDNSGAPEGLPNCQCGQPCVARLVKKEGSKLLGKWIIACGKGPYDQCRSFIVHGQPPATEGYEPKTCATCKLVMGQRISKSDNNPGRGYHSCGVCGRFALEKADGGARKQVPRFKPF